MEPGGLSTHLSNPYTFPAKLWFLVNTPEITAIIWNNVEVKRKVRQRTRSRPAPYSNPYNVTRMQYVVQQPHGGIFPYLPAQPFPNNMEYFLTGANPSLYPRTAPNTYNLQTLVQPIETGHQKVIEDPFNDLNEMLSLLSTLKEQAQRGWSSHSLKELPSAVRVSCRGWDVLFNMDDSLAINLPFPTTSTESRGHPRTELALLTSLSILQLSLSGMLLDQQAIP
ncbi:hypothetical protein D4764_14G0005820 [Takifugu flavidus]|uniref:Uncharacterized protein n=1 Tax=Takifugu flavidus TaxID=433684 RepID=A0A5C6P6K9_9TELE|nr:hypothetical protein D4764_14G0005820 [Takifugu flavidus]